MPISSRGIQRRPLALRGLWEENDPRFIFVQGAKWWQYKTTGATAFPSEIDEMEQEAELRYPTNATNTATLALRCIYTATVTLRGSTLAIWETTNLLEALHDLEQTIDQSQKPED
jgi:hypothetical protein